MVTLAELQAEPAWNAETIPDGLANLRSRLLAAFGLSGSAIGIRGNAAHLRGYHRSRRWIKESRYCTNRTYSVSRTPGDVSGGDSDWVTGVDITLDHARLLLVCQRLDTAVRAGRLEKITEWYGNDDGDSIVDGYDNIANRLASSDSSHLWHLHMSFDRGHANDDHTDVFNVLTGRATTMTDQWAVPLYEAAPETIITGEKVPSGSNTVTAAGMLSYALRNSYIGRRVAEALYRDKQALLVDAAKRGTAAALAEAPPIDPVALAQALAANSTAIDAIATAVAARVGMIPTAQQIAKGVGELTWRGVPS